MPRVDADGNGAVAGIGMGRANHQAREPEDALLRQGDLALRGFRLAEGVLMLVLGLLALAFPLVASLGVTAAVSLLFLIVGPLSWINTLGRARQLTAAHAFWRLALATLMGLTGLWMATRLTAGPLAAARQAASLAWALGVVFVLEGAMATWVSLSNRPIRGWAWGLVNGLVTFALGLWVLMSQRSNRPWLLGTLVGISFLFSGLDVLGFGASFHSRSTAPPNEDRLA